MLRQVFCEGFWALNSVFCLGCVFEGSGCAFLYGFSYLIEGVLVFFRRFFGTLGPRFRGFGSSFLLSSSFFFPLSFSGPAWVLFFSLPCSCCQVLVAWSRQVRRSICFFCLLSLLSFLSPRVGSPLPCSFFLFFFLSLLSLSI